MAWRRCVTVCDGLHFKCRERAQLYQDAPGVMNDQTLQCTPKSKKVAICLIGVWCLVIDYSQCNLGEGCLAALCVMVAVDRRMPTSHSKELRCCFIIIVCVEPRAISRKGCV